MFLKFWKKKKIESLFLGFHNHSLLSFGLTTKIPIIYINHWGYNKLKLGIGQGNYFHGTDVLQVIHEIVVFHHMCIIYLYLIQPVSKSASLYTVTGELLSILSGYWTRQRTSCTGHQPFADLFFCFRYFCCSTKPVKMSYSKENFYFNM